MALFAEAIHKGFSIGLELWIIGCDRSGDNHGNGVPSQIKDGPPRLIARVEQQLQDVKGAARVNVGG